MTDIRSERFLAIFFLAIAITIFVSAFNLPSPFVSETDLGIDFYPKVIAFFLFILSLIMLFQSIQKNKSNEPENIKGSTAIFITITVIISLAVYAFLLQFLGYPVATFIELFFLFTIFKLRPYWLAATLAFLLSMGIYLLFEKVLLVRLPSGFWS